MLIGGPFNESVQVNAEDNGKLIPCSSSESFRGEQVCKQQVLIMSSFLEVGFNTFPSENVSDLTKDVDHLVLRQAIMDHDPVCVIVSQLHAISRCLSFQKGPLQHYWSSTC